MLSDIYTTLMSAFEFEMLQRRIKGNKQCWAVIRGVQARRADDVMFKALYMVDSHRILSCLFLSNIHGLQNPWTPYLGHDLSAGANL